MQRATTARGRGGRPPSLIDIFLVIIFLFSCITVYVAIRQGDSHSKDSALPLLHSLQAEPLHPTKEEPKVQPVIVPDTKVPPEQPAESKAKKVQQVTKINALQALLTEPPAKEVLPVTEAKALQASVTEPPAKEVLQVTEAKEQQAPVTNSKAHQLAGLNCDTHGGPHNDIAREMVYWEDIPSDNKVISKFKKPGQYMTFESDHGGWNNLRMAMETCLAIAAATGRTLVLPPEEGVYLLHREEGQKGKKQKNSFSYNNFFHMESIAKEHVGLEVITMDEFLTREGIVGNLLDKDGQVVYPPENKTDWNNQHGTSKIVEGYLRTVGVLPGWDPNKCMVGFPSVPNDFGELQKLLDGIKANAPNWESYIGHPTAVDASPDERLRENWAWRANLCMYTEQLQNAKVIHFATEDDTDRLLVHFYAFLFFENWKEDLWMKRFVRDHVRYTDEINCAAARVVDAVRQRARKRDESNLEGHYDAFHIRRGDFQYKETRIEAAEILKRVEMHMVPNSTVYIGTDERNKTFFQPIADKYDVVYLDDFMHLLEGVNTNYFGMLDQLITSRSRTFFGCWFSTFTGYINRIRGYHADNLQLPGYEDGIINSYYYAMEDRKDHMRTFYPVKREFFAREFPASWRGIDKGIGELR